MLEIRQNHQKTSKVFKLFLPLLSNFFAELTILRDPPVNFHKLWAIWLDFFLIKFGMFCVPNFPRGARAVWLGTFVSTWPNVHRITALFLLLWKYKSQKQKTFFQLSNFLKDRDNESLWHAHYFILRDTQTMDEKTDFLKKPSL